MLFARRPDIHDKDILVLYGQGLSTARVAKMLGCGKETVRERLILAGVQRRPSGNIPRPHGPMLTRKRKREEKQARIQKIIALVREGKSRTEIKRLFGVSLQTIRKYAGKYIRPAPLPPPPGFTKCRECSYMAVPGKKACQHHLDLEKRRYRRLKRNHPEKLREKRRRYKRTHREKVRQDKRKYRLTHRMDEFKFAGCFLIPNAMESPQVNLEIYYRALAEITPYFKVEKGMVIHHEDENRLNNFLWNLRVFASNRDHSLYHAFKAGFINKAPSPIFDGRFPGMSFNRVEDGYVRSGEPVIPKPPRRITKKQTQPKRKSALPPGMTIREYVKRLVWGQVSNLEIPNQLSEHGATPSPGLAQYSPVKEEKP